MTRPSTETRAHREWLSKELLRAADKAEASLPSDTALGPYVLGWLVSASSLTDEEQSALLDRCLKP